MISIFTAKCLKPTIFLPKLNCFNSIVRYNHPKMDNATHKVSNLEKRFLVWTGKFKSVDEVPAYVHQNMMERARNRMRIRIANYMMALTVIGCVTMAYLGKNAAKRGESVQQQNLDWHAEHNKRAQEAKQ